MYTAWIGRSQLKEMRKERLLDRRVHHAEKIVKMVHAAKDVIFRARSPIIVTQKRRAEATESLKNFGYSDLEIQENEILVPSMCASRYILGRRKIFVEISNYIPTSRILFDASITSNLNQLCKIYRKISSNRMKIMMNRRRENKNIDNLLPIKRRHYEEDEVDTEVNNIVENIESKIQEILGTTDD